MFYFLWENVQHMSIMVPGYLEVLQPVGSAFLRLVCIE